MKPTQVEDLIAPDEKRNEKSPERGDIKMDYGLGCRPTLDERVTLVKSHQGKDINTRMSELLRKTNIKTKHH